MPRLDVLNQAPESEAHAHFHRCCGSRAWARIMTEARPFKSEANLYQVAEDVWNSLTPADWLEAFAHHPRIGDVSAGMGSWAAQEQAGTRGALKATLDALRIGNEAYERKFGFIYLVCATGKSAEDLLAGLQTRLGHSQAEELVVAASEQAKITQIRLEKLLNEL